MVDPGNSNDWLRPAPDQQGLERNLDTIRERKRIVLGTALIVLLAAVLYVRLTPSTYKAETDLLVTPLPSATNVDPAISILRQTNDPARDIGTAANLVDTRTVANRASQRLGGSPTGRKIAADVSVTPVSGSSLIAVTASARSANAAAAIANAYALAAIEQQTAQLRTQVSAVLARLQPLLAAAAKNSPTAQNLSAEIVQLQALRAGNDPTLHLNSRATPPSSASWPKTWLTIILGAIIGLVLGVAGAVALRVLDPRLRREEQLRQLFRLPVLARIPRQPTRRIGAPLPRTRLTPPAIEAYRTLRASLGASAQNARTILVTGASASVGKSTTAINLASSLAVSGNSVILIEADVRRPSIGNALGVTAPRGVTDVMLGTATLSESLVLHPMGKGVLKLLLAGRADAGVAELISLPGTQQLVKEAAKQADYVVIDTSPLTEVVDALPLASSADQVVIVVRLGETRIAKLKNLAEMFATNGIRPVGFVVVGTHVDRDAYYYATTQGDPEPVAGRLRRAADDLNGAVQRRSARTERKR
jgi:capsular exopolysaccharide synthesis family protein